MNTCETCKSWRQIPHLNCGECKKHPIWESFNDNNIPLPREALILMELESCEPEVINTQFITDKKFGCIHHKNKNEKL